MYQILPMSKEYAQQISNWKYDGEYSVYSFIADEETLEELLDGSYCACLDEAGELAGYFCFGFSAQIPLSQTERMVYQEPRLDFGLGMEPARCGKGGGAAFMQAGMDFAAQQLGEKKLRLVVAAFNQRAIHLYEKLGFVRQQQVNHLRSGQPFLIMTCDR